LRAWWIAAAVGGGDGAGDDGGLRLEGGGVAALVSSKTGQVYIGTVAQVTQVFFGSWQEAKSSWAVLRAIYQMALKVNEPCVSLLDGQAAGELGHEISSRLERTRDSR
jgi:hypothetical protein